ncbi:MAG: DNA alkylation repair protein [Candidatus Methanofastidiosia archaeon]|jgi:3-methyladenine DNA glycosylase AlkD
MNTPEIALKFVEYINTQNLNELTQLMTKDHKFIDITGSVEKGRETMRKSWSEYFSMCPEYTIYISEIFVVDNTVTLIGRTTGSHLNLLPQKEFQDTVIWTATIKNGLVTKWQIYPNTTKTKTMLTIKSGTKVYDPKTLAAQINAHLRFLPSDARTKQIRDVRKIYSKKIKKAPAEKVVTLVKKLLFEYGHRFVPYELLFYHGSALQSLNAKEVEELGTGINSWSSTDIYAHFVAGPAWREHQISDAMVHKWAHSSTRWWRRAALVSTVYLKGDVSRTLEVCRMLVDDYDDMVVKALSWALRELIQYDREAVINFLEEYKDVLAARVKREVKNKLTTGLKNPKKGKKNI